MVKIYGKVKWQIAKWQKVIATGIFGAGLFV
jgi:hypothetical protein